MQCFARWVKASNDPAIGQDFEDRVFSPFSLLAFSQFQTPFSLAESRFLVELLFALAPRGATLIVWRNARDARDIFASTADRVLQRVAMGFVFRNRRRWLAPHLYAAGIDQAEAVAQLIHEFWRVWDGNWLLSVGKADAIERGLQYLATSIDYRSVSDIRAVLFGYSSASALTFDDNLIDVFVKTGMGVAISAVETSARTSALPVVFERSEDA